MSTEINPATVKDLLTVPRGVLLHTFDRLHSYYVASDQKNLDAAFDDGKHRYLSWLEREVQIVKSATRSDYERIMIGGAA
ncbi:hypothetical protein FHY35_001386 [Xanthomonas arboricola]|uniref:hypothetical protein n=1 Tax=Xanthomonas arboricola TaxID=56448 RepID=UPI00141B0E23|nr:hypothetical protein [Xanthomonas arboricola]NIJ84431.1 hypothetical protein [Xanthomonas arboricola]